MMELRLPLEKIKRIWADARNLLKQQRISARDLSRLVGKMNATTQVIPPAPLFYRKDLANCLGQSSQDYEATLSLSSNNREDPELTWWGLPDGSLKWEITDQEPGGCDHRIRCIPERMGCSEPNKQPEDQRSMGSPGSQPAHKLLRTTGSNPGSEMLPKERQRPACPTEDRQHDCSVLHQPSGRDSFSRPNCPHQGTLDVVPGTGHPFDSSAHSWQAECNSRLGIQGPDGQIRLETESYDLPENIPPIWPNRGGPVYLQAVNTVPTLFQLAARSLCRGNRCLSPILVTPERICQPSMVSDREGPGPSEIPESPISLGGSSMENPALVPNPTGDANRLPKANTQRPTNPGSRPTPTPCGNSTTTGRMEYLRCRYSNQALSESTSSLMLKSWRSKTNKSYDALFGRWTSWCEERGSDPVSGPVTEVANFLASLFEAGYQYNSLNAYRSAISSIHDKVDGLDIGQHPTITKLLKGAYNERPPFPRYTSTWDVQKVLDYVTSLGVNGNLSLRQHTSQQIIDWDPISLGFLVYIDAVCRL